MISSIRCRNICSTKNQIADIQLDYLILEGNSSRFPLVKRVAEEKAQAKEIIFEPEKLKKSVTLGAIEYGASLIDPNYSRPKGIHKLNYPICRYTFRGFEPIFDRWTSLTSGEIITPQKSGSHHENRE